MLTIKHNFQQVTVVESNYDYWAIYWGNHLILTTSNQKYAAACYQKLCDALKNL
jgi:hypothetical protein